MTTATSQKRILVVDDSAYNRRTIMGILAEAFPDCIIETARDGGEGLQKLREFRPTAITLDLEMPRMDGFTFLRLSMAHQPTPTIVVSAKNDERSLIKALELGALDFISKPTQFASTRLHDISAELVEKMGIALDLEIDAVRRRVEILQERMHNYQPVAEKKITAGDYVSRLILIGASTGGPAAIFSILSQLRPAPHMAIVIAQHMPAGFTAAFADRLKKSLALDVREVTAREPLLSSTVYIAKGGRDMIFSRENDQLFLTSIRPGGNARFVPSIDKLFVSAAENFNRRTLGVILTGMGNDGTNGCKALKSRGYQIIVESEKTAVVFGMPNSVLDSGIGATAVALEEIPEAIAKWSNDSLS